MEEKERTRESKAIREKREMKRKDRKMEGAKRNRTEAGINK